MTSAGEDPGHNKESTVFSAVPGGDGPQGLEHARQALYRCATIAARKGTLRIVLLTSTPEHLLLLQLKKLKPAETGLKEKEKEEEEKIKESIMGT